MKRYAILLLAGILLAAVLTACTAKAKGPDTETDTQTQAPTVATSEQTDPATTTPTTEEETTAPTTAPATTTKKGKPSTPTTTKKPTTTAAPTTTKPEYDFVPDRAWVIIKEEYWEKKQTWTPEDFPNVDIKEIITFDSDGVLSVRLNTPGHKNVLEAIRLLQEYESVEIAKTIGYATDY